MNIKIYFRSNREVVINFPNNTDFVALMVETLQQKWLVAETYAINTEEIERIELLPKGVDI